MNTNKSCMHPFSLSLTCSPLSSYHFSVSGHQAALSMLGWSPSGLICELRSWVIVDLILIHSLYFLSFPNSSSDYRASGDLVDEDKQRRHQVPQRVPVFAVIESPAPVTHVPTSHLFVFVFFFLTSNVVVESLFVVLSVCLKSYL